MLTDYSSQAQTSNQNLSTIINSPIETPKRIELKHEIPTGHENSFLKNMFKSSLLIRECYPARIINSIYFDTLTLSTFDESISGNQIRQKHRIRWYETPSEKSPITYEIKYKNSHLSWKLLHKSDHHINLDATLWDNLFINQKGIQDLCLASLLNLHPVSLVSYERSYYESWDGKIRITIDYQISFRNQRLLGRPNFDIFSYHRRSSIMEMKFAEEDFDLAKNLQRTVRIKPQRFSKYCESVSANNYSNRKS